MFRPVSACAHVRTMQSMRVLDANAYAKVGMPHLRSHNH